jgi:hypothetical protein
MLMLFMLPVHIFFYESTEGNPEGGLTSHRLKLSFVKPCFEGGASRVFTRCIIQTASLLGFNTLQYGKWLQFWRNILPQSSGLYFKSGGSRFLQNNSDNLPDYVTLQKIIVLTFFAMRTSYLRCIQLNFTFTKPLAEFLGTDISTCNFRH